MTVKDIKLGRLVKS